jgi:hypothetical protein
MLRISKTERNILIPAVVIGWDILDITGKRGYWDGDKNMRVGIGPVIDGLVEKGILRRFNGQNGCSSIDAQTDLARSLKCRARRCHAGEIFNNEDDVIGLCESCDGTGLTLESESE